jgi:outer membrane lipoprotein
MQEKVGEYNYAYPRVEASVVYLWPERVMMNYGPGWYDPFWGPYWGPWGPYGWGGYGYWGGYYPTRVIVRPAPRPMPHH